MFLRISLSELASVFALCLALPAGALHTVARLGEVHFPLGFYVGGGIFSVVLGMVCAALLVSWRAWNGQRQPIPGRPANPVCHAARPQSALD